MNATLFVKRKKQNKKREYLVRNTHAHLSKLTFQNHDVYCCDGEVRVRDRMSIYVVIWNFLIAEENMINAIILGVSLFVPLVELVTGCPLSKLCWWFRKFRIWVQFSPKLMGMCKTDAQRTNCDNPDVLSNVLNLAFSLRRNLVLTSCSLSSTHLCSLATVAVIFGVFSVNALCPCAIRCVKIIETQHKRIILNQNLKTFS